MLPSTRVPHVRNAALVIGIAVTSLGVLVLLAWHTHVVWIISLSPNSDPMPYDTALGLTLAGASLCTGLLGRRRWSVGLAVGVAVIAALTLAEYAIGRQLGIDQLIVRDYVHPEAAHPGRVAPNTALCLFVSAVGLLVARGLIRVRRQGLALALCGSLVAGLGLEALAGHVVHISAAYAWRGHESMAVHTAVGLVCIGVALVLIAWEVSADGQHSPRWLAVPIASVVASAALFLWQALAAHEATAQHAATDLVAQDVEHTLAYRLADYGLALSRMAERWETQRGTSVDTWTQDARGYARDYHGERAVAYVDATMTLQRVEPLRGNRALVGLELANIAAARATFEEAAKRDVVTTSGIIDIAGEGPVVLICAPIFAAARSDGFIVAILTPEEFLASALDARLTTSYDVALYGGASETVRVGAPRELDDPWIATTDVHVAGMQVSLSLWPKEGTVLTRKSLLPQLVLLVGLLMATASAMLVHLRQTATRATRQLKLANVELTLASERSEGRLKAIVDTAADGIITANELGVIESFNPAAERMFGYTAREVIGRNLRTLMPDPYHSAHDGYLERYAETRVPAIIGLGREVAGRRKDGSTFAIHLSVSEMSLPEGRRFAGVIRDISDLKRIEEQRTHLLHRVMTGQEEERKLLAEGLHEQVGQELTAVVIGLRVAEAGDTLEDMRRQIATVRTQASKTIEDVRLMAVAMQPGALTEVGLGPVLEADLDAIATREGLVARLHLHDPDLLRMSPDAQLILYRIIHSAVDNVVAHADASRVSVTIRPQGARVAVMVEDDGVGFNSERRDGYVGVGILAMQERATMAGGQITVESTPGQGTVVFIDLPNGDTAPA